jgi:cysteine desulfurase
MLYLDHAASSPMFPEVADTVMKVMREHFANPSAAHQLGAKATQLLDAARAQLAAQLAVSEQELFFTSGATESNALAIRGRLEALARRDAHVIASAVEHPSVYETVEAMRKAGTDVDYVRVDRYGFVDFDHLRSLLNERTVLVSLMHVNSEIGTVQPIAEVANLLRTYPKVVLHVDASQSLGKIPLAPAQIGIDLLTASAHKFNGPRGVGLLYCRRGVAVRPQLFGGNQQYAMRAGTEPVALIAGMAKALRIHLESLPETAERLFELRAVWRRHLATIPQIEWTGTTDEQNMAPHIVHFCLRGYRAEMVVRALSAEQIYVSSQSACSGKSSTASRVLMALGKSEQEARSGLRISYDRTLEESHILYFTERLRTLLQTLPRESEVR